MQALRDYCYANSLPASLKNDMAGLLKLYLALSNEANDEQVLAPYPTTFR